MESLQYAEESDPELMSEPDPPVTPPVSYETINGSEDRHESTASTTEPVAEVTAQQEQSDPTAEVEPSQVLAEESTEESLQEQEARAVDPPQVEQRYNLRSRDSRPDYRAMVQNFRSVGVSFSKDIQRVLLCAVQRDHNEDSDFIDHLITLQVSFQQAMYTENANAAREAMMKEIKQALRFKAFHGVRFDQLSDEERRLILKSTSLFREKYYPTGEFEKFKARFLVRGDMQKEEYVSATSSPVVRHETVMWFIAVSVYCKMKRVKIDFVGAYLNTPRPPEVKYKHVWIPADIATLLIEEDSSFAEFRQPDGRVLVEMDKLFYGYKEAALYWYRLLIGVLKNHGFEELYWDPCALRLFNDKHEIILIITVDDVLAASTSEEGLAFLVSICESEFEGGITIQEGDDIAHLGMMLNFSVPGECKITQDKMANDLLSRTDEWKSQLRWSSTPMSSMFLEHETTQQQELLSDEKRQLYHSLVMGVMYLATKSWWELLYATSVLSGKVKEPKRYHWNALMRVLAYISTKVGKRRLLIKPASLNVIASADASAMCHANMHGQSGGCVGVQGAGGLPDCYLHAYTKEQPIIGKSAMECEVIGQDTIADYAVWAEGVRNDLVPPSVLKDMPIKTAVVQGKYTHESKQVYEKFEAITMQCDNQAAILALEHGRGTFKRCKHILKRFFWVTELINAGRIVMKWISGLDMPADLLTKPVTDTVFKRLLEILIGVQEPSD
jgi:hypothetical protein